MTDLALVVLDYAHGVLGFAHIVPNRAHIVPNLARGVPEFAHGVFGLAHGVLYLVHILPNLAHGVTDHPQTPTFSRILNMCYIEIGNDLSNIGTNTYKIQKETFIHQISYCISVSIYHILPYSRWHMLTPGPHCEFSYKHLSSLLRVDICEGGI